jgi:two-component system LytT family response regulator/two-component system response regulator LytT
MSNCHALDDLLEQSDSSVVFWGAHRGFVVDTEHIRESAAWFKSSYRPRMNGKKQTEIPTIRGQMMPQRSCLLCSIQPELPSPMSPTGV